MLKDETKKGMTGTDPEVADQTSGAADEPSVVTEAENRTDSEAAKDKKEQAVPDPEEEEQTASTGDGDTDHIKKEAEEQEELTEQAPRTIEVDEEEMLFTRRKVKNLEDENRKLNNELEALKDRLLRLTAEYDNFRKRTAKEKEEIDADTTASVLSTILPVMDNLERALIAETDDLPGLKEGVQMTLDQFVQALKKMDVELISTDQGFDPELHEAVMHEMDKERGEREVSEVFLKGYRKGNRVIRHSIVKVVN